MIRLGRPIKERRITFKEWLCSNDRVANVLRLSTLLSSALKKADVSENYAMSKNQSHLLRYRFPAFFHPHPSFVSVRFLDSLAPAHSLQIPLPLLLRRHLYISAVP